MLIETVRSFFHRQMPLALSVRKPLSQPLLRLEMKRSDQDEGKEGEADHAPRLWSPARIALAERIWGRGF